MSDYHISHKMISNETDNYFDQNASKSSSKPSSSRFKDPRIVRVSKALGGKDRHSKVCTVRGLRDRRVRLSVPTAIQLYDLQERLGLNQPSKVVEWLLNAAKHEIDELPPLQIPQGIFSTHENLLNFQELTDSQPGKHGLRIDTRVEHSRLDFYRGKSKEVEASHDRDDQEGRQFDHHPEDNNIYNNYNSVFRFNTPNIALSSQQPPRISHNITAQHEDWRGLLPFQVPILMSNVPSTSHPHHQVVMYHRHHLDRQPGLISTQSYFPSQIVAADNGEFDPKQVNFQSSQMSNSSLSSIIDSTSQPASRSHFNMDR